MLVQPIIDKLGSMKLAGMGEGLREQMENPAYRKLSFDSFSTVGFSKFL